ncbi:hypothetical protein [Streptomyces prunicolor]
MSVNTAIGPGTYNLTVTVTDLHTYYVPAGETPVLVHNSGCDPRFEVDSHGTATDTTNLSGKLPLPKLDGGSLTEVGAPGRQPRRRA